WRRRQRAAAPGRRGERRQELARLRAPDRQSDRWPGGQRAREHGPHRVRRRDAPGLPGGGGGPHPRRDCRRDLAPGPGPAPCRGARGRVRSRAPRPARWDTRREADPGRRAVGGRRAGLRTCRPAGAEMSDTVVGRPDASERPRGRPRSAIADQAIRDAAVELFAERGFEGVSVEDVAGRAGVSRATIYRRYPSKVDLIVEAAGCLATNEIAFPDTGNLRDDLRGLAHSLINGFRNSPAGRVMPVMTFERRRYPELDDRYKKFLADRKARTRALLRRAVERGELPSDTDVGVMSSMLVGPIFHRLMITQE